MTVIAFDLKTIPDIAGGRKLYQLDDLSEKEVANVMFYKRRQETEDSEFLRLHLHRICAISLLIDDGHQVRLHSLGAGEADEATLLQSLFEHIDEKSELVSWNGGEFALPVLNYRALIHGISARSFRELLHQGRHLDLVDELTVYAPEDGVPQAELATLLGLPGALGLSQSRVWDLWRRDQRARVHQGCDADALNAYLLYLRMALLNGQLDEDAHAEACQRLRDHLQANDQEHLQHYLSAWTA